MEYKYVRDEEKYNLKARISSSSFNFLSYSIVERDKNDEYVDWKNIE
jgi:hypothetical protein